MSSKDVRIGVEKMLEIAKKIQKDGLNIADVATPEFVTRLVDTTDTSGDYSCPNLLTFKDGDYCKLAEKNRDDYKKLERLVMELRERLAELKQLNNSYVRETESLTKEVKRRKDQLTSIQTFLETLK